MIGDIHHEKRTSLRSNAPAPRTITRKTRASPPCAYLSSSVGSRFSANWCSVKPPTTRTHCGAGVRVTCALSIAIASASVRTPSQLCHLGLLIRCEAAPGQPGDGGPAASSRRKTAAGHLVIRRGHDAYRERRLAGFRHADMDAWDAHDIAGAGSSGRGMNSASSASGSLMRPAFQSAAAWASRSFDEDTKFQ